MVEGVDEFVYYPLRITDVPAGGLEGLIEYELLVSPSEASKHTIKKSAMCICTAFCTHKLIVLLNLQL